MLNDLITAYGLRTVNGWASGRPHADANREAETHASHRRIQDTATITTRSGAQSGHAIKHKDNAIGERLIVSTERIASPASTTAKMFAMRVDDDGRPMMTMERRIGTQIDPYPMHDHLDRRVSWDQRFVPLAWSGFPA